MVKASGMFYITQNVPHLQLLFTVVHIADLPSVMFARPGYQDNNGIQKTWATNITLVRIPSLTAD